MYNRKILQENNNKNNNAADRSKSTQSASPEAADKQHERKRKVLLSPITESTYQEEFSRFEYMNNAQNAHTKHQNHLAKSKDVLNQTNFDQTYGFRYINISLFQRVSFHYRQAAKWKKSEWMRFLSSRMPITGWLLNYNWKSDLFMDILGGVMISVMSVPQSLAYGMLVGVPPSYGLITGIIGPITYALFGTSRHSSPGAFAIVSLMVGGVVERLGSSVAQPFNDTMILTNENGPGIEEYMCCKPDKPAISEQTAIEIATAVTLLVGVFQILFGLMNAGLLAVWLSDHLVQGLTSGAAIHVLTSQLKSMTGISNVPPTSEPFQLIQFYICFFKQIASKTQLSAIICSIICITLLILSAYIIDPFLRKCCSCPIKFPMELLLVIGSTLIVQFTRQTDWHFEIAIVGHVDSGIPTPRVPRFSDPFNMLG
ncbi:unnamed protein product [Caenorhabditis angaria]|uniref:SLC26A/SulP transporter domain-containing protein n=1 Tax=Caenorhabditis angaria TaxID=860376 RepID=A0A9P1MX23_9PELO|nr:unnamed protein product [Caenorhabditis angaria]